MSGFCVCSVAKVKVGVWPISAQPLAELGQEAGRLCGAGAILSEARVSLWHLTCDLDVLTFGWNLSLASTAGGLTREGHGDLDPRKGPRPGATQYSPICHCSPEPRPAAPLLSTTFPAMGPISTELSPVIELQLIVCVSLRSC